MKKIDTFVPQLGNDFKNIDFYYIGIYRAFAFPGVHTIKVSDAILCRFTFFSL